MSEQNIIATLRLIRSENVGPRSFYSLVRKFGTPQNALDALPEIAAKGGKKAVRICSQKDAETELKATKKLGINALIYSDAAYPDLLKQTYDAPPLLFYKGNVELLARKQIGVVGTRNASANGCSMTRKLAVELGEAGMVVTSGLARGVDTHAHKAALPTGTIAVVANGLDSVYPPENEKLFAEIAENGLIVSENPIGTNPQSRHFPQRNRIIAGLSSGVLVVEAATRSGSLITADYAAREGREIFAVPGSPLDPRCSGTNFLLKNGAVLVESARDIIENLGREIQPKLFEIEDDFEEEMIFESDDLRQNIQDEIFAKLSVSPVNIDELAQQTDVPIRLVNEILLELEIAGKLERSWGNKVRLLA
jgi:DNA processing protein